MTSIEEAYARVPVLFYTHHAQRGETEHRSAPESIRRELTALQVPVGTRVLEIGTGSGYSGAMLAELVGPTGRVVSVDVSEHLAGWANLLHHQRGLTTVTCLCADGAQGHPADGPYDRVVSWCAFPRLPKAWIDQLAPDGRIVACLPVAAQPSTTLITTVTLDSGRKPQVEATVFGGYAQSSLAAVEDALTIPGRWVDWSIHHPQPSWVSIAWRHTDDRLRTGARTTLDRLLSPGHTETSTHAPVEWHSWNIYTVVVAGSNRTVASLPRGRGIGHSTPTSAAIILTDGTIVADSPRSPSLTALRNWLHQWERDVRPAVDAYTTTLKPYYGPDLPGWDLRLTMPQHGRS